MDIEEQKQNILANYKDRIVATVLGELGDLDQYGFKNSHDLRALVLTNVNDAIQNVANDPYGGRIPEYASVWDSFRLYFREDLRTFANKFPEENVKVRKIFSTLKSSVKEAQKERGLGAQAEALKEISPPSVELDTSMLPPKFRK